MKPIIGFDGYYVDYPAIIGKYGRILKPGGRDCFTIYSTNGKRFNGNRWKLIWAAQNNVDPRKIPRAYSFKEQNGTVFCETFSERMSTTVKQRQKMATIKWSDYDFIEQFAHTAKKMLRGDMEAKVKLFTLLNSRRDELIEYARKANGGVGIAKATDYTDKAIYHVYNTVIEGCYHVPSPMASMKWHIRHYITQGRKRRDG